MAAAAKPQAAASRRARPCMAGAFLCCPPPWASSTSGRPGIGAAAPAGDQRTPGMSPSVNRRSETPSVMVSDVKRIGFMTFRDACGRSRATYVSGTPERGAPILIQR